MPQVRAGSCILIVALLAGGPAARGQFTAQRSSVALGFTDLRFTGAQFMSTNRLTWLPRFASDSQSLTWFTDNTAAIVSRSASPIENCTIEGFQAQPGNSMATYTLRAIASAATVHEFALTSRPDGQRVAVLDAGGQPALSFNSFSSPLPTVTAAAYTVVVPGDWSSRGGGEGQLEFLGINSGWMISRDFEFDGLNTVFEASRTGGGAGIGLRFVLHGAAAPAPGSFATIALALAGAARLRRRGSAGHLPGSVGPGTSK